MNFNNSGEKQMRATTEGAGGLNIDGGGNLMMTNEGGMENIGLQIEQEAKNLVEKLGNTDFQNKILNFIEKRLGGGDGTISQDKVVAIFTAISTVALSSFPALAHLADGSTAIDSINNLPYIYKLPPGVFAASFAPMVMSSLISLGHFLSFKSKSKALEQQQTAKTETNQ